MQSLKNVVRKCTISLTPLPANRSRGGLRAVQRQRDSATTAATEAAAPRSTIFRAVTRADGAASSSNATAGRHLDTNGGRAGQTLLITAEMCRLRSETRAFCNRRVEN